VFFFFVTLFVFVIAAFAVYNGIKAYLKARKGVKKQSKEERKSIISGFVHTAWMANFTLRFCYEFFFELCLCLLIHTVQVQNRGNFLWVLSLMLFVAGVIFIIMLCSLFFRGGPYLEPSSFSRHSLINGIWGIRYLKTEYPDDGYSSESGSSIKSSVNDLVSESMPESNERHSRV